MNAPMWCVYYGDHTVITGANAEAWRAAPDVGVQVVSRFPRMLQTRPWRLVDDRDLWTGTDEYNPFGWGVKYGSLIPDAEYFAIWERAAYGSR